MSEIPPPSATPPGGHPTQGSPQAARAEPQYGAPVATPPKRPLPAWVIAIPLMALTGVGGYYLAQSNQAGSAAGNPPGMSAGAGTATTGRRHRRTTASSSAAPGNTGMAPANTGAAGRSSAGSPTIAVTAQAVKEGTLSAQRTATATVSANNATTLTSRNSGTITSLNAAVGQVVSPNQVLVTLSNPDLQAAVQSAQTGLKSAQTQLESQQATLQASRTQLQVSVSSAQLALQNAQQIYDADQKLYAVGAISRTDLNAQAVAVQNARSSLASAQNNLNQNTISQQSGLRDQQLSVDKARIALNQARQQATQVQVLAPYAGKVTTVSAAAGQYVTSGTALLSLVSSEQQLTFNVPPSEAGHFTPGRELSFKVGQQSYPVKVSSNPGSASSGVVGITARFVGNTAGNAAGQVPASGTVGAVSYTSVVGKGILVPTTALQVDTDKTSVFVAQKGKAVLKPVTVQGQTGDTAVVSGIESGVQVITTPPAGLINGSKVDTNAAASAAPMGGPGGPP